ncbi:class I SAM-dependent methyltransferase [Halanaerobaculum tunisiense]
MNLPPQLYHWLVRPKWLTNIYINNLLTNNFTFQDKEILDFGCGIGATCPIFNPDHYLGVDPDQQRINYATNLHPNYQFLVLTENHLNLPPNSIDYVLLIAVLHHMSRAEIKEILPQLQRILTPTGKILAIEPHFVSNSQLNNQFMDLIDNGSYIRTTNKYFTIFQNHNYQVNPIKKYSKLFFYNEVFFSATPS